MNNNNLNKKFIESQRLYFKNKKITLNKDSFVCIET